MHKAQQLFEEAQAKYQQAKTLLLQDTVTAAELDTADHLRAEADGIKSRANRLLQLEQATATPLPQWESQPPSTPTEFKDWKEFVGAFVDGISGNGQDSRLKIAEHKTMSGSTGSGGGVLIPTAQLEEIWRVEEYEAVLASRATRIGMESRSLKIPALDQTGTTVGEPHFFGGVNVYMSEEGADIGETDPALSNIELVAREITGATSVTNSLLKDVTALAAYLRAVFPKAMTWKKEYLFLRGSGAGQPLGILNATDVLKAVTRTTSSSIEFLDLVNMEASFMGSDVSGIWLASLSAKAKLLAMSGPAGNPSYLWGSAKDGTPRTLMGRPIFWTDKLPAVGTKGDLLLVDPTYYLYAPLEENAVLESDASVLFRKNQTAFRMIERFDGQPWLRKVITLADGSTTVSPFMALAA